MGKTDIHRGYTKQSINHIFAIEPSYAKFIDTHDDDYCMVSPPVWTGQAM